MFPNWAAEGSLYKKDGNQPSSNLHISANPFLTKRSSTLLTLVEPRGIEPLYNIFELKSEISERLFCAASAHLIADIKI